MIVQLKRLCRPRSNRDRVLGLYILQELQSAAVYPCRYGIGNLVILCRRAVCSYGRYNLTHQLQLPIGCLLDDIILIVAEELREVVESDILAVGEYARNVHLNAYDS